MLKHNHNLRYLVKPILSKNNSNKLKGFTLVEVTVVLFIMLSTLVVLAKGSKSKVIASNKNRCLQKVSYLANQTSKVINIHEKKDIEVELSNFYKDIGLVTYTYNGTNYILYNVIIPKVDCLNQQGNSHYAIRVTKENNTKMPLAITRTQLISHDINNVKTIIDIKCGRTASLTPNLQHTKW